MFKRFGDWQMARNLTRNMENDIKTSNEKALMRLGLKAEKMAVMFIQSQSLSWAPLNPDYLERKVEQGHSDKILIRSSTYFQSITSMVENMTAFAGVTKQTRNEDGEIVADIARVLEYGSIKRNIPPRPLWQVVFKHMRQYLIKEKLFAREALQRMRRHGI